MTKMQIISDVVGEGILDHLLQGAIVPSDAVLVLCRLNKIIDCLSIIGEENCHNSILVVILW